MNDNIKNILKYTILPLAIVGIVLSINYKWITIQYKLIYDNYMSSLLVQSNCMDCHNTTIDEVCSDISKYRRLSVYDMSFKSICIIGLVLIVSLAIGVLINGYLKKKRKIVNSVIERKPLLKSILMALAINCLIVLFLNVVYLNKYIGSKDFGSVPMSYKECMESFDYKKLEGKKNPFTENDPIMPIYNSLFYPLPVCLVLGIVVGITKKRS